MPRLLPLLLALLTLLGWSAPAQAIERLAVLELTGKALTTDERAILTDTVRGAVVDSVGDSISVMTRENMEVMMTDMGMDATCVSEGACEVETARNLGVDYVISGSVASMSGTQVVSLKLLETRSGRMLGSKQVMGADALALMQGLREPTQSLVTPLRAAAAPQAALAPVKAPAAVTVVPAPASTRSAAVLLKSTAKSKVGGKCGDVMNMVRVGVPTAIVVATIEGSGWALSDDDVACLEQSGAPSDVIAAAQKLQQ